MCVLNWWFMCEESNTSEPVHRFGGSFCNCSSGWTVSNMFMGFWMHVAHNTRHMQSTCQCSICTKCSLHFMMFDLTCIKWCYCGHKVHWINIKQWLSNQMALHTIFDSHLSICHNVHWFSCSIHWYVSDIEWMNEWMDNLWPKLLTNI